MIRRIASAMTVKCHGGCPSDTLSCPRRLVFSDKVRAGMILRIDNKHYRVLGNSRSQKGQNAASFHLKLEEIGIGRRKEVTAGQGHDFDEVRAERVRLIFSGFDNDDFACFVYPEHHAEAGKEVNLKGDSLPELQQKFLCVGMPVDILHIPADEDNPDRKEIWAEVLMPVNYVYTVEKLSLKGMYKMAALEECDGVVSVNDAVQPKDKIKVVFKQSEGTASFGGKASP